MSTSEEAAAGLPGVEELARLASQMFRALPGAASPATPASIPATPGALATPGTLTTPASLAAPQAPVAPVGFSLPSIGVPDARELQELFVPASGALRDPAPFAQPTARVSQDPAASFYFLEHSRARAMGGTPAGIRVPGAEFDPVHTQVAPPPSRLDVQAIRRDFPILAERVQGRQLVWLDNAATTQKPRSVIDRLTYFYERENSNIHRAAHDLAARATDAYEGAREKVRAFLNAPSTNEIVFVRGTTEAINLVAQSWGRQNIGKDDEIIISWLEHHANIVPWQQLIAATGARLRVIPVDSDGQVILEEYARLLSSRTRLVSFTQVSNALGTVTPAKQIIDMAHAAGARTLLDGAQSVSHMPVDVQALGSDFFVFSGHKVFGPTGIGVLHGKEALLNSMPPWQGGGNMITDVTLERSLYHQAPGRFEAGTGNIADAVGLGAAIDYVTRIGMDLISAYEHELLAYGTQRLQEVCGLHLVGTAKDKAGVLSFVLDGHKTEDVGKALSREGIAVRAGHHCAQPILRRFGLESTVRPSLAFYNTTAELDLLVDALHRLTGRGGRGVSSPGDPPRLF